MVYPSGGINLLMVFAAPTLRTRVPPRILTPSIPAQPSGQPRNNWKEAGAQVRIILLIVSTTRFVCESLAHRRSGFDRLRLPRTHPFCAPAGLSGSFMSAACNPDILGKFEAVPCPLLRLVILFHSPR